jgi:hypothetical protein
LTQVISPFYNKESEYPGAVDTLFNSSPKVLQFQKMTQSGITALILSHLLK